MCLWVSEKEQVCVREREKIEREREREEREREREREREEREREEKREIPLVFPPGVDRHLFYTTLGAFYTDVCLSHLTGPKEQLHGVDCNTLTHTVSACCYIIV